MNGRQRGEMPPVCPWSVAYIDTHDKALYWTVVAFEANRTPYVLDYGTWPEQPTREFSLASIQRTLRRKYPKRTTDAAIYAGMLDLVAELHGRRMPKGGRPTAIDLIVADTGYKLDLWQNVKTQHPHLVLTKGIGIKAGNKGMAEWPRKPGEVVGEHWLTPPASKREHAVTLIDTNHWKTAAMDALAAPAGEPGALTLFGDPRTVHALFASHMDAESFVETEGHGRKVVEWQLKPSKPDNHWFDCLVGCLVGASMLGARPEGAPAVSPRGRVRRRYTQEDLKRRRAYAPS